MSQNDEISDISRKLDALVRLTAYQLVVDKTLSEGAPLLRRLGLNPSEIAAIYDSTVNTVNVRISEAKSRPKKKSKSSVKPESKQ